MSYHNPRYEEVMARLLEADDNELDDAICNINMFIENCGVKCYSGRESGYADDKIICPGMGGARRIPLEYAVLSHGESPRYRFNDVIMFCHETVVMDVRNFTLGYPPLSDNSFYEYENAIWDIDDITM